MAWKYVMFENHIGGTVVLLPVIFPDKLVHADVYARLKSIMPGWKAQGVKALSAGTIEHVRTLGVGGESETLGKKSRGEQDHRIITQLPYMHGIYYNGEQKDA